MPNYFEENNWWLRKFNALKDNKMMGFGFVGTILVIALIAYLVGWRPQGDNALFRNTGTSQSPREILETRYARGEISKQEFDEMREDIRS
jgi:putative membrane protein